MDPAVAAEWSRVLFPLREQDAKVWRSAHRSDLDVGGDRHRDLRPRHRHGFETERRGMLGDAARLLHGIGERSTVDLGSG